MGPTGRPPAPLLPLLLLLLLLLLPPLLRTSAGVALGHALPRHRRGVIQLAGAILCATDRTPLAYLRYGCYCGLGGTGWPRDETDWCCFRHDCCYAKAEKEGCAPKTGTYSWECKDKAAKCEDVDDTCQELACECDQEAARCLAKAPYHTSYLFWPESLCGSRSPNCKDD